MTSRSGPVQSRLGSISVGAFVKRYLNGKTIFLGLIALIVAYLALVPVITLLVASFQSAFLDDSSTWTLGNYGEAFTDASFYRLLLNSLAYSLGVVVLSMFLAVSLAWLYARTNTPFKGFAMIAALVPLVIPGILNTVAWLFLLSPQIGILNALSESLVGVRPFDVYGLGGMIFIESIHIAPIAFIMVVAAFSSMDTSMEEAAVASGASTFKAFRSITLRLATPAIFAAALLMFIRAVASFEVPQLVGVPGGVFVFVSQIYSSLQGFPPNYGVAGSLATVVLLLAVVGALSSNQITKSGERYSTVTGRGFKPATVDLGAWKWLGVAVFGLFFLITTVLPIGVLLYSSLLPGYQAPSMEALSNLTLSNYSGILDYPLIRRALTNSIILSVITGIIAMLLTAIIAYITVKTRVPGRGALDALAFTPIAIPGIVMGIGILLWYLIVPLPVNLYGTLTILTIAFVTLAIPYGMRFMSAGMIQINDELEEAASISGASWFQSFLKIYIPLLIPSLLAGFVYTLITTFREISAPIFLYSQGSEVVSIAVFDLWEAGRYSAVAALGVVMVAILIVLVAVFRLLGGRIGLGRES